MTVPVAFATKAETLEALEPLVRTAKVLPQVPFSVRQWKDDPRGVIARVSRAGWLDIPLIVRSSARAEDALGQSLAGHFTSVLGVRGERALRGAIDEVVASYRGGDDADLVFIQPMLEDVVLSGVAFTRDPNTGGSYLVINYNDANADTGSVTSGSTNDLKTYYFYKAAPVTPPPHLQPVVDLARELESLFGFGDLDIEFAATRDGGFYLLQARPLVCARAPQVGERGHAQALAGISRKIGHGLRRHPYLHGPRTVYGVMPDWNPAEIIGVRPRPLALSLYKALVTDAIWAYQRNNYGYRNLRSFPLLIDFCGLPYIDVRVSFNSFVPAATEAGLADRLVSYYIDRLLESPAYHDKVEFKIIFSCYTLDLPERLQVLRGSGFSADDCSRLADDLRRLTNRIIHIETGLWRGDVARIKKLEARREQILASDQDEVSKIYWLLEDCKRYGTLPFAGLARAGFIAVQLLQSLVAVEVLSRGEYDHFLENLESVSTGMARDFHCLSREEFLARYGHLRPGTYDLLSPRYDEAPDRYFDWNRAGSSTPPVPPPFALTLPQLKRIEALLKDHGLEHDVLGLFDFIKEAIEGREYSKFVFTRSLSAALSLFKEFAGYHGLSAEEASYASVETVNQLYSSAADSGETLRRAVEAGKEGHALTRQIVLPPLITSPEEVYHFHVPQSEPNYITQKEAAGPVAFADSELERLKGSVLLIPSADPGFDWVFSHGISGLVTMYGGVNSHMAIRAGELGIPSVIGAGEMLFQRFSTGKVLEIDAANRQVRIIR